MNYKLTFTGLDGTPIVSAGRFGLWKWDEEEETLPPASTESSPPPNCNHEWVNVSLNQIKMACKYCGIDKSP